MTITGGCLCGAVRWESTEPPIVTRVCWCRECQYVGAGSGTVNAGFRTAAFNVSGKTNDYPSVAGQRQPYAQAILSSVRNATLQRGRVAAASHLRARWNIRRSQFGESCVDDLDIERTTLGLHQRKFAASSGATAASSVVHIT